MDLSLPALLILLSAAAGIAAILLTRWPRAMAVFGAVVLWLLAWGVWTSASSPDVDTWRIYGRAFTVTAESQAILPVLTIGLSLLFLLTIPFPQGRRFVPGCLLTLAALFAALLVDDLGAGALFLFLAASLAVVVIQGNEAGSTRPSLRYLVMMALTVPCFLLADWLLGQESSLLSASRLLLLAFLILLASFPFHIWVGPIVGRSPPLASIFLLALVQMGVMAFIFQLLATYPWLTQTSNFTLVVRWAGTATALVAALIMMTAVDYGRLWAGLILLDMGLSLLTLALPLDVGWETAVVQLTARYVSLLLAAVGWLLLRQHSQGVAYAANRGLGRQWPLSVALLILGAFSLLGMPLTVGFNGRWAVLMGLAAADHSTWALLLLFAAVLGAIYGVLRGLLPLLADWSQAPE